MKRTIGITIFGYSIIALGISSFIFLLQNPLLQKGISLYSYLIYFLALLFIGIGILLLKEWARILLFILMFIKIIGILFGAIPYVLKAHTRSIGIVDLLGTLGISIFVFWFFTRESVKVQFRK